MLTENDEQYVNKNLTLLAISLHRNLPSRRLTQTQPTKTCNFTTQPTPTHSNPTHGWTQPTSYSVSLPVICFSPQPSLVKTCRVMMKVMLMMVIIQRCCRFHSYHRQHPCHHHDKYINRESIGFTIVRLRFLSKFIIL